MFDTVLLRKSHYLCHYCELSFLLFTYHENIIFLNYFFLYLRKIEILIFFFIVNNFLNIFFVFSFRLSDSFISMFFLHSCYIQLKYSKVEIFYSSCSTQSQTTLERSRKVALKGLRRYWYWSSQCQTTRSQRCV